MCGYEVEAHAYDFAGNTMKKTAGGGLTYLLGKLVAGTRSFLLRPALAGAVFGFFLGFMAGFFEDLSILLQIHGTFNATTQLPQLMGNLTANPGLIVEMIKDMVGGHMMRCNLSTDSHTIFAMDEVIALRTTPGIQTAFHNVYDSPSGLSGPAGLLRAAGDDV